MSKQQLVASLVPCVLAGAAFAAETPDVEIHGFVSQGYLNTSKNNYLGETQGGTFDFNEAAINFQSQLTDDLRVGAQLYARDLDGIGQDRVGIDWAYADYHWKDALGFRVGEVKVARGLYNEYSDIDLANPTVLLPQAVYDERLRDFLTSVYGGSVYGTIPMHEAGSFDYEAFGGSQTVRPDGSINDFVRSNFYNATTGTDYESNTITLKSMYGASGTWNTPLRGLRFVVSALQFNHLLSVGNLSVPGPGGSTLYLPLSLEVSKGQNVVVGTEYSQAKLRLAAEGTIWNMEYSFTGPAPGSSVLRWAGWYVQAAYQFLPRWGAAATIGTYYDNRLHPTGNTYADPRLAYQKTVALTLRFDPVTWVALKAEGAFINGYGQMFVQENPNGYDGNTLMLSLKATVSF